MCSYQGHSIRFYMFPLSNVSATMLSSISTKENVFCFVFVSFAKRILVRQKHLFADIENIFISYPDKCSSVKVETTTTNDELYCFYFRFLCFLIHFPGGVYRFASGWCYTKHGKLSLLVKQLQHQLKWNYWKHLFDFIKFIRKSWFFCG